MFNAKVGRIKTMLSINHCNSGTAVFGSRLKSWAANQMSFANSGTKMPQHQPIAHDGFHLAKPSLSEHSNVDYLINK